MKRAQLVVAAIAAFAVCVLVPIAGAAAGPADATCQGTFTATARDLVVSTGTECLVTGATITRDLILEDEAGAEVTQTGIGRDVVFGDFSGALIFETTVGHDLVAGGTESGADVFQTTIGHDLLALGENSGFDVSGTTVGHDMKLLGLGGGTHMELTTIGHDFFASKPQTVQTGRVGPDTPGGPVRIGHDFTIDGSPGDDFAFVFDGICDVHVARDFTVTNRSVTLGFGIGNICARNGLPANEVGRDLVITNNHALDGFFGPSALIVGDNHVGRDLVFSDNTAVPGGSLEVSRNVVAGDAACAGNNPPVTVNGPNVAGGSNTCG